MIPHFNCEGKRHYLLYLETKINNDIMRTNQDYKTEVSQAAFYRDLKNGKAAGCLGEEGLEFGGACGFEGGLRFDMEFRR